MCSGLARRCQYRLPSWFAGGYEVTVQRPPMLGIRHLAIQVNDLAATEQFWVDVLGFRVEWRPDADNVYLTSGHDNLALHRAQATGAGTGTTTIPKDAGDPALDHIGLAVASASDVDGWASFLRARGVVLHSEPRTHRDGSRSLYFRDTAGTLVQILWHVPIST